MKSQIILCLVFAIQTAWESGKMDIVQSNDKRFRAFARAHVLYVIDSRQNDTVEISGHPLGATAVRFWTKRNALIFESGCCESISWFKYLPEERRAFFFTFPKTNGLELMNLTEGILEKHGKDSLLNFLESESIIRDVPADSLVWQEKPNTQFIDSLYGQNTQDRLPFFIAGNSDWIKIEEIQIVKASKFYKDEFQEIFRSTSNPLWFLIVEKNWHDRIKLPTKHLPTGWSLDTVFSKIPRNSTILDSGSSGFLDYVIHRDSAVTKNLIIGPLAEDVYFLRPEFMSRKNNRIRIRGNRMAGLEANALSIREPKVGVGWDCQHSFDGETFRLYQNGMDTLILRIPKDKDKTRAQEK